MLLLLTTHYRRAMTPFPSPGGVFPGGIVVSVRLIADVAVDGEQTRGSPSESVVRP